jgi:hypothetical protein
VLAVNTPDNRLAIFVASADGLSSRPNARRPRNRSRSRRVAYQADATKRGSSIICPTASASSTSIPAHSRERA